MISSHWSHCAVVASLLVVIEEMFHWRFCIWASLSLWIWSFAAVWKTRVDCGPSGAALLTPDSSHLTRTSLWYLLFLTVWKTQIIYTVLKPLKNIFFKNHLVWMARSPIIPSSGTLSLSPSDFGHPVQAQRGGHVALASSQLSSAPGCSWPQSRLN